MKVDKIVYMLPQWHTQQIKIPKPIKGSLQLHPFSQRPVTHHHKPNTKTPTPKISNNQRLISNHNPHKTHDDLWPPYQNHPTLFFSPCATSQEKTFFYFFIFNFFLFVSCWILGDFSPYMGGPLDQNYLYKQTHEISLSILISVSSYCYPKVRPFSNLFH